MNNSFSTFIEYSVLFSHVLLVFLLLAVIFRKSWGKEVFNFLFSRRVLLAFLVSLSAVVGSLFYSEVIGFEPCLLCWWQRVFLYPIAIIVLAALIKGGKGRKDVFTYLTPLALIAGLIGIYQQYTLLGGESLLACTDLGGACSKIYVMAFGYITIPMMSITVSLYILLLAYINKIKDESR